MMNEKEIVLIFFSFPINSEMEKDVVLFHFDSLLFHCECKTENRT